MLPLDGPVDIDDGRDNAVRVERASLHDLSMSAILISAADTITGLKLGAVVVKERCRRVGRPGA
jgi:hypothetical protein